MNVKAEHLSVIDHWTAPGSLTENNEDGWGRATSASLECLFLVDGCTDLDRDDSRARYPGSVSSACWHKTQLLHHLERELDETILSCPHEYLGRLVTLLRSDYEALGLAFDQPDWAYPSTTLIATILSPDADLLRVLWIGDSYCSVRRRDGAVMVYPPLLEEKAELSLNRKQSSESGSALLKANLDYYRHERTQQIRTGVNSLSLFPDRLGGLKWIDLRASDYQTILLASDGYYRLITDYHLFNPSSLMEEINVSGLKMCGGLLRHHETTHAREISRESAKIHDDATAVLAHLHLPAPHP